MKRVLFLQLLTRCKEEWNAKQRVLALEEPQGQTNWQLILSN